MFEEKVVQKQYKRVSSNEVLTNYVQSVGLVWNNVLRAFCKQPQVSQNNILKLLNKALNTVEPTLAEFPSDDRFNKKKTGWKILVRSVMRLDFT